MKSTRLFLAVAVPVMLAVALTSYRKDKVGEAGKITITTTFTGELNEFYLAGSGQATIDWGDGKIDDVMLKPLPDNSWDMFEDEGWMFPHHYYPPPDEADLWEEEYIPDEIPDTITITITGDVTALVISSPAEPDGSQYYGVTRIDVSKMPMLRFLDCSAEKLTSLDVSKNIELVNLFCQGNELSELNLTSNTALEYLNCSINNLSTLDISQNTALEGVECIGSNLTSLTIANTLSALEYLICYDNKFDAAALDDIFSALPDRTGMERGMLEINIRGCNECENKAGNKNWLLNAGM
ncbi:MAG: hypothetical protein LBE91_04180 [Tannerella sp.]|nr:hypothetical protein [Tannerella sp.]